MKREFLIALLLSILFFLVSRQAKAEESPLQYEHDWAHVGTSFAIQTIAYGVTEKVFKVENPFLAALISGTITFAGTSAYELYKAQKYNAPIDTHTIGMNSIGIGLSLGTCFAFSF
jgi:hypothetical protein